MAGSSETIGSLAGGGAAGGNVTLGAGTLTTGTATSTTYAGVISGTGGLTKVGTGVFTLTGNNTYTGTTTVSAGTLEVGSGGTSGSIAGDIIDNSLLQFNRSDSLVMNGNITGSGRIIQVGAGTTTLNGNNVLSALSGNAVTVNAGTLIMNGGSYRANVNDGKAIVITDARAELNNASLTTTDGGGNGSSFSTSGAFCVSVSGTTASVTGSNLTMDTMGTGLWVSGGASVTVSNLDLTMRATGISQGALGSNAGIWAEGVGNGKASTVSVSDSTITLTGNRTAAAYATGNRTITLNSVDVTSAGTGSIGLLRRRKAV